MVLARVETESTPVTILFMFVFPKVWLWRVQMMKASMTERLQVGTTIEGGSISMGEGTECHVLVRDSLWEL